MVLPNGFMNKGGVEMCVCVCVYINQESEGNNSTIRVRAPQRSNYKPRKSVVGTDVAHRARAWMSYLR